MDEAHDQIQYLCQQLALAGSEFSFEEVEEILQIFKEVSLKLIITNVPREVYSAKPAQDAFETLFKSFDPQATFLYLPSFNRAQVFVTKPEAALCARLQTQGWRLPESVLAQIPSESISSSNIQGIRCYIDHMDDEPTSADEFEVDPPYLDEDVECTCDVDGLAKLSAVNIGSSSDEESTQHEIGPVEVRQPEGREMTAEKLTSSRFSTPDHENTSEASGDDVLASTTSRSTCPKHGASRKMKHLAPPKPSRQFLLSPPASPPVGWAPKPECEPVINYELLEALASLAPGETFELQPQDPEHARPSIVITPCESHTSGPRPPIVQTRCPDRKSS